MEKNVMIPLQTFERIILFLECVDLSRHPNCYDFYTVLWELKVKMQKIELRDAYTKIVQAKDDDARHEARIEYLRQRNQVGIVEIDDIPF